MLNIIFVGAGGFIGAVMRYLIGLIPVNNPGGFPVLTFIINIIGAFFIGVIAALAAKYASIDPKLVLFLKTGICGGFTTFSTFSLETADLFKTGSIAAGILYIILSVTLCILAVFAGQFFVK